MRSAASMTSAIEDVIMASLTSRRPNRSMTVIVPPCARCASTSPGFRRHSRTSWPAKAKSPAAANEPLPPPNTAIFKMSSASDPATRFCLDVVFLPRRPGRAIDLEQVTGARIPAAAVHAGDQTQRLRIDVTALRVQDYGIVDMGAKHAVDDGGLPLPRHQRGQHPAFERHRRFRNAR